MREHVIFLQKGLMACECLAAFAGIMCWMRIKDYKTKMLVIYLIAIAVSEQVGWYLKHHGYKTQTSSLYAYFVIPLEFVFAYWFINRSSRNILIKKASLFFVFFGLLINAIELIFLKNEKFFFSSLAYISYALFLVILVLMFFYFFIKTEKIITWWREIEFWVAAGYLIYYLCTFPLYAFYNSLYKNNEGLFYVYWEIQMWLNMIMYLIFTMGIIWTSRKLK